MLITYRTEYRTKESTQTRYVIIREHFSYKYTEKREKLLSTVLYIYIYILQICSNFRNNAAAL